MKVTPVGYFRELRHGMSNGPSLRGAVAKGEYTADKTTLLAYLRAGLVYVASPGVGTDVLDETGKKISGQIHALTDGRWMWPADLAYYVETYDVALPDQFLLDLRRHEWRHPEVSEIDVRQIEVQMP